KYSDLLWKRTAKLWIGAIPLIGSGTDCFLFDAAEGGSEGGFNNLLLCDLKGAPVLKKYFEAAEVVDASRDFLLALDPPDPNYAEMPSTAPLPVTRIPALDGFTADEISALNALLANEAAQAGLKTALLH